MPALPPYKTTATSLTLLKIPLILLILNYTLAYPTSISPVADGSDVITSVGQHTLITTENWALGIVLILAGFIEVFFGFKFIRLTLLVTGFLSCAVTAMVIMVAIRWDLAFTTFNPHFYYFWVWLASGLTGATLAFRYWDLGVTFAGAFGGFALAMGIVATANLSITNAGRYVIMGIFILGGATIASFFEREFIIAATAFGGAYVFMFGVDEFTQVGYREMIVIFDFTGKTLTYHPNLEVYVMLASSLVLAALGIAWELWHHETPLLVSRKAVFRIYGRPFGKRPKKLIGQRIHHNLKTRSDLYAYIIGCFCLQRWSIDDALYSDQDPEAGITDPTQNPISGDNPAEPQSGGGMKEPKPTDPSDNGAIPLKPAPVYTDDHTPQSNEKPSDSMITIVGPPASSGSGSYQQSPNTHTDTSSHLEHTEYSEKTHTEHMETTHSENHSSEEPVEAHSAPHHPLFTSQPNERMMRMISLVAEDVSPGNTIPRELLSRGHHHIIGTTSPSSNWPASTSTLNVTSTVSHEDTHSLHMLEVSESSHESHEYEDGEHMYDQEPQ
ncbi:hypothetical protein BGZ46_009826 [Entomortierella lignicola]|nr:hypothetical protein BGZ46_009826 [Entomortierella lignicola]